MDVADPQLLTGAVEVDETYVGGKRERPQRLARQDDGAWRDRARRARGVPGFDEGRAPNRAELHQFVKQVVADDAEAIYTDAHHGLPRASVRMSARTRRSATSAEEWVRGERVHAEHRERVEPAGPLHHRVVPPALGQAPPRLPWTRISVPLQQPGATRTSSATP